MTEALLSRLNQLNCQLTELVRQAVEEKRPFTTGEEQGLELFDPQVLAQVQQLYLSELFPNNQPFVIDKEPGLFFQLLFISLQFDPGSWDARLSMISDLKPNLLIVLLTQFEFELFSSTAVAAYLSRS